MMSGQEMRNLEGACIGGKYKLVQYLSEGGFGAVFRGVHMAYEVPLREVAIKVGKRAMDDREARAVFRDAMAVARMTESAKDPRLREKFVLVYDAGRCADQGPLEARPYVVMELVRGGSLRSCLRAGAFPLKRACAYFDQMLGAVAFMHGGLADADGGVSPLIHRDIKPDNFLIVRNADAADVVKITDFGLAVDVDALLGWTESGGDLAYLPPEAFTENLSSPKSDCYMLALVFYEMVTGRSPFVEVGCHLRGTDEEKRGELRRIHIEARQNEDFVLLNQHEELRSHPEMTAVVRAALRPDRATRPYENAIQFLQAWTEAKAGEKAAVEEQPWDAVRRLTGNARQCLMTMDEERGMALLEQALDICRKQVPNHLTYGDMYLLVVQQFLKRNRLDEAKAVAREGHARRECHSTLEALACVAAVENPNLSALYRRKARECSDRE